MRLEDLPPAMREQAMAALGETPRPKKNRKGATRVATDGWCATCREHFTSTAVWEKHCDANPGHSRFELIWTALREEDGMQNSESRKRDEERDAASEPTVSIPLDMANDLRQWAEVLSVEESWKVGSYGDNTLRAFKGLLHAAAEATA